MEKRIRIVTEQQPSGQWIATSPDLPGLVVAERTLEELVEQVPTVIEAMYRARGVEVRVRQDEPDGDLQGLVMPWVVEAASERDGRGFST